MKAILTAAALLTTTLPAMAFDPASMSDAEKAAFGSAVRDYLMENPEVLVEAINGMEARRMADEAKNDKLLVEQNKDAIFNDGKSWVGGNPDGDITLVEFVDYRCGYCKRVNPELEELIQSDGNIRFIIKEFPILTAESEMAARFAVAVQQVSGPEAYKKVHDALMSLNGPVNLQSLTTIAEAAGADAKAAIDQMNGEEVQEVLRANKQLAQGMNIQGTPTFIINGEMLRGIPQVGMKAAVEQIREQES
ncbi:DsbA family protein [Paracoccus shanxieyensis]|uniref:Thioredoxin domain-containing protein n=1 Tax=Paracoccus shanxieyensis TaxID=2675752 RepID=A0A6L6IVR3_9RHOB|nr:DsbA family protein [Paracoccus shanxieyensis]MTH63678.1 thioredoxin domain-containing protein [Paracoccus shanxieyensis]MTH86811.1 thioredoxin domain-containing protein [Paracoccus shanxieyensis]